jgi:hypothetical protein
VVSSSGSPRMIRQPPRDDKLSADIGVWRSLVAHLLWEQGAGGSNPLTPTIMISVVRDSALGIILVAVMVALPWTRVTAAERKPPTARKSPGELAAEVARTTKEYRATLERALPALEANARNAEDAVHERRKLHAAGVLSAEYVTEAERAWAAAQSDLAETREAIDEADRIVVEASVQEQLMRRPRLPRGGYEDTATLVRFNGTGPWALAQVPQLDALFRANFGRSLPISSFGQTKVHDRLGLDHREAIDVAVHPDSAEGRWLMQHLRRAGIPFIGVRGEIAGSSTGAHVHVGPPSLRFATR